MNLFVENLQTNPRYFFAVCFTVIVSICIHELCHGIVAIWQGDRTPIETGHMTLNPMVHMGATSVILLLMAGIAWGAMPINPKRMKSVYSPALVALAGPVSNMVLAVLAISLLGLWQRILPDTTIPTDNVRNVWYLLRVFALVNIALALFNLIPIPPLDGSRILANLSPAAGNAMVAMRQGGGMSIAFLVIFFFSGSVIFPASRHIFDGCLQLVRGF
jgi:Zn-dependent protease